MDRLSEAPHRRDSPCKGLLITASIFSCWIQATSAQGDTICVVASPPYGKVGSEVTLSIQGFSKMACRYTWYRKSVESSNQITSYHIQTRVQEPESSREVIFPNGSLLIPNLTLSDNDDYILQVVHSECEVTTARTHLQVYDLHSTGIIKAGILVGAVTEVAIIGAFIYVLCIRKIGRASQGILRNPILGRRIRQAQKEGDDSTLYMNNALLQGCPRLLQVQGSSSAASEDIYQALDIIEADVYDTITPCQKPPAPGKGKITKS
ncbi:cell adhesion molecule CEACAM21-like isoform X2 [Phascolarctos cinereus]|uniref:Carcinoembryonic antigen-related cell adhesion molecule 3-like isoform X2 n=1 Tax=Phascolarctos cinereus TaxID=38626 RepID=A0A6P5LKQ6_PHACI|nr:carcinoembryonic antigen-related cell adhesion molecule 3-like isoform X2 [Phascolarctos cinereus]